MNIPAETENTFTKTYAQVCPISGIPNKNTPPPPLPLFGSLPRGVFLQGFSQTPTFTAKFTEIPNFLISDLLPKGVFLQRGEGGVRWALHCYLHVMGSLGPSA